MSEDMSLQKLEGRLERLTFQNEQNGYTVARLVPKGRAYEVTVVGPLEGVQVGESVRLQGVWTTHPKYGRQFEARSYEVQLPATVEGIRKYLGSGLIKGIGPVMASRIVDYFGRRTLDVIEENVTHLRAVSGIGAKRVAQIARAWKEQKQIKEVMLFLQSYGVSTGLAVKIYKQYGDEAAHVLQKTPYRLARDIYGIGFKTADKIAQQMGIALDSPARIQAGLRYALGKFSDDGHCFATHEQLVTSAAKLLNASRRVCEAQLAALIQQEELIAVQDEVLRAKASTDMALDGSHPNASMAIYLPPFYYAEQGVVGKISRMLCSYSHDRLAVFLGVDWERAFAWLDGRIAFRLSEQQRVAVRMALTEKVSILTGGPGTGKSTITAAIIHLLRAKRRSVLLAAPTGRAAKHLSEATGLEARTIHRLLEFTPGAGHAFLRDHENPLDADMIIVDEASMIDVLLMNHLLKAIDVGTHLLLVGDVDQLPSVGPGNVLRDMIECGEGRIDDPTLTSGPDSVLAQRRGLGSVLAQRRGLIPVTRLDVIFRQAADSFIILNAHRINQGKMPLFPKQARDFFLFREADPERAADLILDIVARRIPAKFGYQAERDIQVLSPMHRGPAGVGVLNHRLQARLNPSSTEKPEWKLGQRVFRVGDRVMQIRNNYDKQVFNGDMGRIRHIDLDAHLLVVDFEGLQIDYEFSQLDELVHAYAVSVHKAQGSEFPAVVMPILTQHYMLLQRNLLYTGVTRACELVVLVGSKRALAIAVHNEKIAYRNTRLADALRISVLKNSVYRDSSEDFYGV
jgi:exodeoxyribonuclease V alpha subunit